MEKNYIILCAEDRSGLEQQVNHKIELGYVPTGGIEIRAIQYKCIVFYYQAMVKEEVLK